MVSSGQNEKPTPTVFDGPIEDGTKNHLLFVQFAVALMPSPGKLAECDYSVMPWKSEHRLYRWLPLAIVKEATIKAIFLTIHGLHAMRDT